MNLETNTEFVERLMTQGCPTGALSQVFVIQALDYYSKVALAAGAAKFDSNMLSGEAWVKTAQFVQDQLEARC